MRWRLFGCVDGGQGATLCALAHALTLNQTAVGIKHVVFQKFMSHFKSSSG